MSEIAGKPGEALYLPGNVQLLGYLMYSRPIFAEVGIDPASIATFDDFIAACGQIRDAGYTPMSTGGHPAALVDYFQSFVEVAAPGKMALAQVGQAKFTDEDIVAAFDLTKRFFDECAQEGAVAEQADPAIFPPVFAGDAAMSFYFGGTPWFGFVADVEGGGRDWMHDEGRHAALPWRQGPRGDGRRRRDRGGLPEQGPRLGGRQVVRRRARESSGWPLAVSRSRSPTIRQRRPGPSSTSSSRRP